MDASALTVLSATAPANKPAADTAKDDNTAGGASDFAALVAAHTDAKADAKSTESKTADDKAADNSAADTLDAAQALALQSDADQTLAEAASAATAPALPAAAADTGTDDDSSKDDKPAPVNDGSNALMPALLAQLQQQAPVPAQISGSTPAISLDAPSAAPVAAGY